MASWSRCSILIVTQRIWRQMIRLLCFVFIMEKHHSFCLEIFQARSRNTLSQEMDFVCMRMYSSWVIMGLVHPRHLFFLLRYILIWRSSPQVLIIGMDTPTKKCSIDLKNFIFRCSQLGLREIFFLRATDLP